MPWLREKKFWPSVTRIDDGECLTHALCCPFNRLMCLKLLVISTLS